jgi:hypothetical protein
VCVRCSDGAPIHKSPNKQGVYPVEVQAAKMIKAAAGANVGQGNFSRYQYNKIFVKRDANGKSQRVLFGSMNFSIRGLYIEANTIMVLEDQPLRCLGGPSTTPSRIMQVPRSFA